ncbi:MAG: DUF3368 domain-containing protein [Euryarchaeota archaeon]|nr:DUF3368 domain-containing protein [Euryarchaeota archaeon]
MIVVSDSTPLIHFAKIGRIDIIFTLYGEILITREVYNEAVEEGLILEKEDAVFIKEHIGKEIQIRNSSSSFIHLIEKYFIHKGEAGSIQLALETNSLLLINERDGRNAAKKEGIKVKGSIGILFDALGEGVIDKKEALGLLSRFREEPQDFWIDPDIIKLAMEKINLKK